MAQLIQNIVLDCHRTLPIPGGEHWPAPLIPTFSPTEVGFTRLRHFKSDRNRQQPISIGGEKEQAAANGKAKFLTCSSVRSLRWSVVAKTGLRELEKRSCPM